jgi:hypothetical protein
MSQEAKKIRVFLLTTALATGLVLGGYGLPAQAQSAAASPGQLVNKQTLPLAIAAAEKFSGGKAMEIRFRVRQGVPGFDAVTARPGGFSRVRFEIPSSTVAAIGETDVPTWMSDWVLKADAKSLTKAKLSLAQAVVKAEDIAQAPAVDAGIAAPLTASNAVLGYNVQVFQGERPQRLVIDGMTGQPIQDPDQFMEAWSPEHALSASIKKDSR